VVPLPAPLHYADVAAKRGAMVASAGGSGGGGGGEEGGGALLMHPRLADCMHWL